MRTGKAFDVRKRGYLGGDHGVPFLRQFDFTWRQELRGRCAICDVGRSLLDGLCDPCRYAIQWPDRLKEMLRNELYEYLDDKQAWYLRAARVLAPRGGRP